LNFCIHLKTNSYSISFVHWTSIKDDEAILPSLEFHEVVYDFLGSKIFVFQNALSVIVSHENNISLVDGNNVMLFENYIVNKLKFFVFDFSNVSWILPNIINHDWMTWCHFKAITQSAKIYFATLIEHLDKASNCRRPIWSRYSIIFDQMFNHFDWSISHLDHRFASETATTTSVTFITCIIVINSSKLCCTLRHSCSCLGALLWRSKRWLWWVQWIVNIICSIW